MDQLPSGIPLTQLINPIHTSNQNAKNGESQEAHKDPELPCETSVRGHLGLVPSPVLDRVVGCEADEDSQREDLETQAGDRDVHALVRASRAVRRHAAAGGLQG